MTTITPDRGTHTVIVTVDADPEALSELARHATAGLELFAGYAGFISGATHVSEDGGRLIQYLQWSSVEDYDRCVDDPDWDRLPSTRAFLAAVESGSATLDARPFRVVATSGTDGDGPRTAPNPGAPTE